MPLFYYLPKIHKDQKNPPGRPIIAGINSPTSNLSEYINIHLQKHVIKLNSYLRDTTSLIENIKDIEWSPGYKWATLEVTALYTNIPHEKGIQIVQNFLNIVIQMPSLQKKKNFYLLLLNSS